MNFREAVDKACEEPTLLDALSWIAIWECERVVPIAHKFLNRESNREPDGRGWDTCMQYLFKEVSEQYGQQKTLRAMKGTK
jgi:hypothetical protein